jgi:hypothetical protein
MTRARDVANIDGLLTTKGDIYAATAAATPARLGVGNNGDTLVADSSTSTGLRYTALFGANKNKIINGDFSVNQREFTSTTTTATYGFDRWFLIASDGTSTYSRQAFTPGEAPVTGYESTNFARLVSTGQTLASARTFLSQRIEDVRILAGQTVTISFWAKASTGTPSVAVNVLQNYGSGGSTSVEVNGQKTAITSSWARYSLTFSMPTLTGKTLGSGSHSQWRIYTSAGSDFNTVTNSLGIQTTTIDIWGVQLEAGSTATPFQTATGTIQGELAACQRYFFRCESSANFGNSWSTSDAMFNIPLPSTMRVNPTATFQATYVFQQFSTADKTGTSINAGNSTTTRYQFGISGASGCTIGLPTSYKNYVDLSSEL